MRGRRRRHKRQLPRGSARTDDSPLSVELGIKSELQLFLQLDKI